MNDFELTVPDLYVRDYCDAQAGFWLNSKFWSKFSRKPLSGIEDQKASPPFWKTSDLGWPKFTPEYPPPISENFRFGMTKVYSGIPSPPFRKTSDLGWPKFTPEYPPPFRKTSDLGWPKFNPEYPPHFGKLQIWDDQNLLWNTPPPPHFGKLQIWADQSLLQNTPPFRKTSDLGWPKFTLEYPPPNENCQRVQVRDFQNTESYYMWRLYPTRITTSSCLLCSSFTAALKIPQPLKIGFSCIDKRGQHTWLSPLSLFRFIYSSQRTDSGPRIRQNLPTNKLNLRGPPPTYGSC